ncbi:MAG: 2-amino-4-hydroxy-6-hydroxymethyldihydropteridine diphosphokinase [Alistipes sp.]
MARVVILTGGNIGDVKTRLQHAQQLLNERVGAVLRCSHRYESEPWGFAAGDPDRFSNQVLELSTDLSPEEVLNAVLRIEDELGRDRTTEQAMKASSGERYTSRKIDIDILFYDDRVISSERLTIPHPHIGEREFVLEPLCEIMRSRRHPVTGKSLSEMWAELKTTKVSVCGGDC